MNGKNIFINQIIKHGPNEDESYWANSPLRLAWNSQQLSCSLSSNLKLLNFFSWESSTTPALVWPEMMIAISFPESSGGAAKKDLWDRVIRLTCAVRPEVQESWRGPLVETWSRTHAQGGSLLPRGPCWPLHRWTRVTTNEDSENEIVMIVEGNSHMFCSSIAFKKPKPCVILPTLETCREHSPVAFYFLNFSRVLKLGSCFIAV